ncbi:hypothetical protein EIP86_009981 [Pleurotus ostreatoroseus]|nr:hypothetical protein EIP86_009981 [Pleurotus ostreatoroseus]
MSRSSDTTLPVEVQEYDTFTGHSALYPFDHDSMFMMQSFELLLGKLTLTNGTKAAMQALRQPVLAHLCSEFIGLRSLEEYAKQTKAALLKLLDAFRKENRITDNRGILLSTDAIPETKNQQPESEIAFPIHAMVQESHLLVRPATTPINTHTELASGCLQSPEEDAAKLEGRIQETGSVLEDSYVNSVEDTKEDSIANFATTLHFLGYKFNIKIFAEIPGPSDDILKGPTKWRDGLVVSIVIIFVAYVSNTLYLALKDFDKPHGFIVA